MLAVNLWDILLFLGSGLGVTIFVVYVVHDHMSRRLNNYKQRYEQAEREKNEHIAEKDTITNMNIDNLAELTKLRPILDGLDKTKDALTAQEQLLSARKNSLDKRETTLTKQEQSLATTQKELDKKNSELNLIIEQEGQKLAQQKMNEKKDEIKTLQVSIETLENTKVGLEFEIHNKLLPESNALKAKMLGMRNELLDEREALILYRSKLAQDKSDIKETLAAFQQNILLKEQAQQNTTQQHEAMKIIAATLEKISQNPPSVTYNTRGGDVLVSHPDAKIKKVVDNSAHDYSRTTEIDNRSADDNSQKTLNWDSSNRRKNRTLSYHSSANDNSQKTLSYEDNSGRRKNKTLSYRSSADDNSQKTLSYGSSWRRTTKPNRRRRKSITHNTAGADTYNQRFLSASDSQSTSIGQNDELPLLTHLPNNNN